MGRRADMSNVENAHAITGNFQGEITAEDRERAVARLSSLARLSDLRNVMTGSGAMDAIERIVLGTESGGSGSGFQLMGNRLPELLVDVRGSELLSIPE